jgi:hypothetical protein
MTDKERYRILCEEKSLPLFMQAWWLDAVCSPDDKQWDVLLYEENNKIIAALPYHLLKKWNFKIVIQPQLTQYNGIWIDYPTDQKLHKRYSFEEKIINNLIDKLEALKLSYFSQTFHHSFTNWQPFYWRNFKQTTRYTYIIKNIVELEKKIENIQQRYRQRITKSETELIVAFDLSPENFYDFYKKFLTGKKQKIEYSKQLFLSIYNAAIQRNQGKIISINNKDGKLLSAVFLVWDVTNGYNFIPARDIVEASNDASIFMTWQAIKFLRNKTQNYDFEGSMIKGIAAVNQRFGAEQIPYFHITKCYSLINVEKISSFLSSLFSRCKK